MTIYNTTIFFLAGAILTYTQITTPGPQFIHSFVGGFLIGMGIVNVIKMCFERRLPIDWNNLAQCMGCKRTIPNDLINALIVSDKEVRDLCAVCGLNQRNEAAGLPHGTLFTGTMAKRFYKATLKYYKQTKQT